MVYIMGKEKKSLKIFLWEGVKILLVFILNYRGCPD